MLKKIFCVAIFCAAIYCAAASLLINAAAAQDIWFGTEDGVDYYVMEETFVNRTQYRYNRSFDVEVKLVQGGDNVRVATLNFYENDGLIHYHFKGNDKTQIASPGTTYGKIWDYGLKVLGIDYEVSHR